ncbi:hypothetical protein GCM10027275_17370 [Rhabdobacter roseus]|uniref:N-acetylglutamate synthase-like GNAT family acetyltransferase n=1 Tax=Rhabdobacter roseus TaxID=1655419 RepID=A0A840TJR3_9BACT|nr:GNAT family N-acetyltransferase [Rhabdobacter roseus]MBB5283661.1 N-acetylglutamate synthase-like GNAT family acetyltransferase [Rhabdobacter roseus]
MINIRVYQEADLENILALLRLNTPRYFAPHEEADLVNYLNHEMEYYYLVEQDQQVRGCGGINLAEDGRTAKLSWDIIHPQYQGRGLGRALMQFRIQRIRELEGIKTISVRTSQLVYPFYEKFGLETREIVKNYWGEGLDLYRLDGSIDLFLAPK